MKTRITVSILVLVALIAGEAVAHEISFDRSSVRLDDYVTLTIVLEDEFVGTDHVRLPLQNLTLISGPSTSTEFRWVNGETSRRRVLTYRLRPDEPGTASVGPVVVTAPNGDQLTLKRVTTEVIDPVRAAGSIDDTLSLSRLPAVVVEVSKREAFVGEQIEVRWSVYGENIRGVQLLELPSLDGFWVEQLDSDETNRELIRIGDELIQRQTIRHTLLYPLRAGSFEIAPLAAAVRVYRRDPLGDVRGWNPFNGAVTELTRRSDGITVDVSDPPRPDLPVGSFELSCSDPRVPSQGPVAIDLTLAGAANLRSVSPPEFSSRPRAGVEIEPLPTTVQDREGTIVMKRGWRYLLFPEREGPLHIPPLKLGFFDPAVERVRTAQCGGWDVIAAAQTPLMRDEDVSRSAPGEPGARSLAAEYWVPAVVTLAALLLLAPLLMRVRRRDGGGKRLLALVDRPAQLRSELERWLIRHGHHPSRLRHQAGELGEAWRGVSSLLDLVEREPWELERSKPELSRRLRDLVEEITG